MEILAVQENKRKGAKAQSRKGRFWLF